MNATGYATLCRYFESSPNFHDNLYWSNVPGAREKSKFPDYLNWYEWQASGNDTGSLWQAWLSDGYIQIFKSCLFGPSGFWTMALLRYTAKFDPFLSLDCARVERGGGEIQGKEGRDQGCAA